MAQGLAGPRAIHCVLLGFAGGGCLAEYAPPYYTYLMEELGQLYLHLLPLKHVVLGLLADGWDQVELSGH